MYQLRKHYCHHKMSSNSKLYDGSPKKRTNACQVSRSREPLGMTQIPKCKCEGTSFPFHPIPWALLTQHPLFQSLPCESPQMGSQREPISFYSVINSKDPLSIQVLQRKDSLLLLSFIRLFIRQNDVVFSSTKPTEQSVLRKIKHLRGPKRALGGSVWFCTKAAEAKLSLLFFIPLPHAQHQLWREGRFKSN